MSHFYAITEHSITVYVDGVPHTVRKGEANFNLLRDDLLSGGTGEDFLTVEKVVHRALGERFKFDGDRLLFNGSEVPMSVSCKVREILRTGGDPEPIYRFWERLSRNPSRRSMTQLFDFLAKHGMTITSDGHFLAYKSVRPSYRDHHTDTIDNSIGCTNAMPRNQISDDPRTACHKGLHVGSLEYARSFNAGSVIVVCQVCPSDVVCVPYDHGSAKIRTCKYTVVGHPGEKLPDSIIDPDLDFDQKPKGNDKGSTESPSDAGSNNGSDMFYQFDSMDTLMLMSQSLADLRRYASSHLKIVGASKIRGGKAALVSHINRVRALG